MTAPDVALRAELLERTQWAHEFSFLEIEKLAEYLQSRSVKRGMVVFREGDRDHTLFVIAEGKVRTYDMGGSATTLEMGEAIARKL